VAFVADLCQIFIQIQNMYQVKNRRIHFQSLNQSNVNAWFSLSLFSALFFQNLIVVAHCGGCCAPPNPGGGAANPGGNMTPLIGLNPRPKPGGIGMPSGGIIRPGGMPGRAGHTWRHTETARRRHEAGWRRAETRAAWRRDRWAPG
jgi:hypothetical protein